MDQPELVWKKSSEQVSPPTPLEDDDRALAGQRAQGLACLHLADRQCTREATNRGERVGCTGRDGMSEHVIIKSPELCSKVVERRLVEGMKKAVYPPT